METTNLPYLQEKKKKEAETKQPRIVSEKQRHSYHSENYNDFGTPSGTRVKDQIPEQKMPPVLRKLKGLQELCARDLG